MVSITNRASRLSTSMTARLCSLVLRKTWSQSHMSRWNSRGKLGKPVNILNSGEVARFLFGQLAAFPYFAFFRWLAQEQQFAMLFVVGVGIDNQFRLLLFDARQIKQVGVGNGGLRAIGIGRASIIRVDDHQGVGWQEAR